MCEEKTLQRYGLYPYQLYRSGTLGLCQPPYAGEYRELEGPRRGWWAATASPRKLSQHTRPGPYRTLYTIPHSLSADLDARGLPTRDALCMAAIFS